jgi:hypothetical protein
MRRKDAFPLFSTARHLGKDEVLFKFRMLAPFQSPEMEIHRPPPAGRGGVFERGNSNLIILASHHSFSARGKGFLLLSTKAWEKIFPL